MAVRRGVIIGTAVGALVAGLAVGALLQSGDDGQDVDAVLDEPGQYQTPGIGTNAAVAGTPLPSATVRTLDGEDVDTADLTGTPMVLNVWFSTCQPCKRELPHFAAVSAELGDQVSFVGINPYDVAGTARSFAADFGITYPTYLDSDGEFVSAAGIATFPSTLFVAADGRIVRQTAGDISEQELRDGIQELLG